MLADHQHWAVPNTRNEITINSTNIALEGVQYVTIEIRGLRNAWTYSGGFMKSTAPRHAEGPSRCEHHTFRAIV